MSGMIRVRAGLLAGLGGALLLGLIHCGEDAVSSSVASAGSAGEGGAGGTSVAGTSAEGGAAGEGGSAQAGSAQAGNPAGGEAGGGQAGAVAAAPYELIPLDNARITSDGSQPNFQHVSAEIDLKDGPFEEVIVEVALATTCYPFENWKNNPPPEGQNYPADCDAFDRNFETILDEPKADGEPPGLEVIRAITPFGGPLTVTADLTDFANFKPGKHTIHVRIPTWSDGAGKVSGSNGGWNVTAKIKAKPGVPPRNVLAVQPLLNLSLGASDAPAPVTVITPEGTKSARIEYRATGHGGGALGSGCIGPAEEFCKRTHSLFFDASIVEKSILWRTDCGTLCTLVHYGPADAGFDYCAENPTGAIESVKAPRANWCPGSMTPPLVVEKAELSAPGTHEFTYKISKLQDGGIWRLSGVYYAYGE